MVELPDQDAPDRKKRDSNHHAKLQSHRQDEERLEKRAIVYQPTDRLELIDISLPPKARRPPRPYYFYDSAAGGGIIIYAVDSGLDYNLAPEFKGSPRLRWLFVDHDERTRPWTRTAADEADSAISFFHGSNDVLKAAGKNYGIAKAANVVMVRFPVPQVGFEKSFLTIQSFAGTYGKIKRDIVANHLQGKIVINYPLGSYLVQSRS